MISPRLLRHLYNFRLTTALSTNISKRMQSTTSDLVLINDHNDKGIITLNRPKALNSINLEMVKVIVTHLKEWEKTKNFVLIKGIGDKSFCAGGDVRAVVEAGPTKESKNFFYQEYTMNGLIGTYKIPYIALIDGITMGGGVGLSIHGKYRIATERTLFAMPETRIGFCPDVGASYFLSRLQGKLGLYLALTGHRLKGEDVYKYGLATHYCDSSELSQLENELLNNAKNNNDVVNILDKFNIKTNKKPELDEHMNKINKYFNANTIEEIFKNLENDNSDWSKKTLNTLNQMSPTSLKITLKELEIGSKLSLLDCLKMEYRLAVRHLEDSDFKEGVRALLIDKDQKPNWNPSSLDKVTNQRVESFFVKLPPAEELMM